MTPRPLRLIRSTMPPRPTAAWFIAGGGPAEWLEELSHWSGLQESLKLFVVPRVARDRIPGGLLVIPEAGKVPRTGVRALPLGLLESKLFLPVDAELSPPVTPQEIGALCKKSIALFHPGIGLVEFEASDELRVWGLLGAPQLADSDWNSAQNGPRSVTRLRGIELLLPQMGEIFEVIKTEIGSAPPADLPPRAGEPSAGAFQRFTRALSGFGAMGLMKLLSMLPSKRGKRTWLDSTIDWAAGRLVQVSRELEELRHAELHRLMSLLENDPEQGLRHALPLDGTPGRGQAKPGSRLGSRDIQFNLGRLLGGKPADRWDVPLSLRQKLTTRYRELALREQQLGRFKRAAYIYAELLRDLSAAAAVLKEGKLFAEAAVLYRDHLKQTRAAAECFVKAGLFSEAIAIYEKEGAFLELGDLYRQIGDEAEAATAYRRVVESKVAELDFLGAALVLEDQLRVPDEALALLGKGWPRSPQAAQCLAAELMLLGRLNRHEDSRRRLSELRADPTAPGNIIPLAHVLAGASKKYPDQLVRALAADLATIKVSEGFTRGNAEEVRAGALILNELVPEDRLLARDASRFLAARLETLARENPPLPRTPPRNPGSSRIGPPVLARTFSLPNFRVKPGSVKRCGQYFVALSFREPNTIVVRGDWTGNLQAMEWHDGPNPQELTSQNPAAAHATFPLVRIAPLALDEQDARPDYVLFGAFSRVRQQQSFAATDRFAEPLRVGTPAWMPHDVCAISLSEGQWWLLRHSPTELILEARQESGRLLVSFALSYLIAEIIETGSLVSMLALHSQVWLAFGTQLLLLESGKIRQRWTCESQIMGLQGSAPFMPRAVVVLCRMGAAVFWCDHLSPNVEMVGSSISSPLAAFLGNGGLVLLAPFGDEEVQPGQVLDLNHRGILSTADFYFKGNSPVGLVGTNRPDEFAIFTRSGECQIQRLPSSS